MRLSEAIALGRVTIQEPKAGTLAKCALGMAVNACGLDMATGYTDIERAYPWLRKMHGMCPVCSEPPFRITDFRDGMNLIIHIFDCHVACDFRGIWTLDQLIDWVRSVEPAEEEPQQVPVQEKQAKEVAA